MNTISCAMIVRDSETTLERAMRSVRDHVDELVVVDTGSLDGTVELARQYADSVQSFPWVEDFAAARQFADDQCTGDWLLFLDSDDEMIGGETIREAVDAAPDFMGCLMMKYITNRDPYGRPTMEFWRERLCRRGLYRWTGRIHEVRVPTVTTQYGRLESAYVIHHGHGDGTASMIRNVTILRKALEDEPRNARYLFYLGRDLMLLGDIDEALALLERYMPLSDWTDERFAAQSMVAHCHRVRGRYDDAYQADLQLLRINPLWPQTWFNLAQDCYFLEKWDWCVHYNEVGQLLPKPDTNLFQSATELQSGWMIFQTVALTHLGRLVEAAELTATALQLRPDDTHHQMNARYFARELNKLRDQHLEACSV